MKRDWLSAMASAHLNLKKRQFGLIKHLKMEHGLQSACIPFMTRIMLSPNDGINHK
jgi:hypothetical protein